ncbi:DNA-formamidopyrimidine glycosylase family protein [Chitinophaga rhizophila]|uniref:Endonuclease n=1 Tax=Chitinophaga rhizophila TaxID=2866212 RepID=A0ABS7GB77_9BACT|nr:DNA-formamidopyrimidine glycosylase family protein [Chitinophaga rhizophila]MBW8684934.1 endonuclease [Chitinophaga rhizophila]
MPEGPSIVILKEEVAGFKGKKITDVSGYTKIDLDRLLNKKIIAFKSWGKHFLICFKGFTIRIHLLMFGSYRINEKKDSNPALHLGFGKDELNFYTCAVKLIEEPLDEVYDWSGDVMSETWDARKAMAKLKQVPDMMVADALLNQDIFAGSGNIIKNEVMYRIRVHPESKVGSLPLKKKRELIKETVNYSFDFLHWKKEFKLKEHWLAHTKKICPRCNIPFHKAYIGATKRRTFYCTNCQVLYQ